MVRFVNKTRICTKQQNHHIFLIFILLIYITSRIEYVYAQEYALPEEVLVVKNEQKMIQKLQKSIRNHENCISFYYPGIAKDFKKYQKKKNAYSEFFDKLAKRDGYMTGIISGACITVRGIQVQYVTFQFGYLTTKKQERYIDKKVRSIVKKIGKGSSAYKARAAHDYLIEHIQYDSNYFNPYHAFSKGRGMCMSYALAYQRILQEMGIPCIYVKGINHAWNMVKIGKYWYNVDVTWDDNGKRYRYFLKSDSDFPGHKRPRSKWLESLCKAKTSYFGRK